MVRVWEDEPWFFPARDPSVVAGIKLPLIRGLSEWPTLGCYRVAAAVYWYASMAYILVGKLPPARHAPSRRACARGGWLGCAREGTPRPLILLRVARLSSSR
jgi:hypothetical protein